MTGAEITAELRRLHEECEGFLRSLPADIFVRPQGDKWSPADHVRHLAKSSRPVAMAMSLPRFLLWLRFGRPRVPSRSLPDLREDYRARLAAGATAGRFTPSARPIPADGEADRIAVLASWRLADADLRSRMGAWDEPALDRYRLPHPSLGLLTIREMLLFTLYHNAHHLNLVAARVEM